jgi:hypothetical protein
MCISSFLESQIEAGIFNFNYLFIYLSAKANSRNTPH